VCFGARNSLGFATRLVSTLVVLVFVPARAEFSHPLQHLFQPLQLAHDLPGPVALLHGLYTVVAVDVYVAGDS